jgi:hypothetical protein
MLRRLVTAAVCVAISAVSCTVRADNRLGSGEQNRLPEVLQKQQAARHAKLALLRAKAEQRVEDDSEWYSDQDLHDIEARYMTAHLLGMPLPAANARSQLARVRERRGQLQELIDRYPRSNRAGCAVIELAQLSRGEERERFLKVAIAEHDDAWFENGAQVGPLARALLATYYAGLDRFDEAEELATEIVRQYAGSVDLAGASLDDVLPALKKLRPPR